jgi:hypothetical protein
MGLSTHFRSCNAYNVLLEEHKIQVVPTYEARSINHKIEVYK